MQPILLFFILGGVYFLGGGNSSISSSLLNGLGNNEYWHFAFIPIHIAVSLLAVDTNKNHIYVIHNTHDVRKLYVHYILMTPTTTTTRSHCGVLWQCKVEWTSVSVPAVLLPSRFQ